ncbi:hypothetical protein CEXT_384421 [Caerostris extrusa]|uniref:Uncharacterized protein n=1 Tax=Caerostris extrusa TaxID=172846 RepID=A0AAV4XPF3_CAEEX|nr:hypothetical protein CEXT_384421 [Caerostris extrusa]
MTNSLPLTLSPEIMIMLFKIQSKLSKAYIGTHFIEGDRKVENICVSRMAEWLWHQILEGCWYHDELTLVWIGKTGGQSVLRVVVFRSACLREWLSRACVNAEASDFEYSD